MFIKCYALSSREGGLTERWGGVGSFVAKYRKIRKVSTGLVLFCSKRRYFLIHGFALL